MAKAIKGAFDPTDNPETQDILSNILAKEKSRHHPQINAASDISSDDISRNTATPQYSNTASPQYSNIEVQPESPDEAILEIDDEPYEKPKQPVTRRDAIADTTADKSREEPSRARNKRTGYKTPSNDISRNTAIPQYSNTASPQYSNIEVLHDDGVSEALSNVRRMRATEVITLRIPYELNEWLEEYVFAHRKEGFKKQEVVAWAITLLRQELEQNSR